ncbi:MAG: hypothetical protein GY842_13560 [bacterium]|nr:hypothetical protein [bacterium]
MSATSQDCWEYKKCGREPNGPKVGEFGVCPAAELAEADGFCGGTNGGRACAYITGTFCGGTIQGTHRDKEHNCKECDFYKELKAEHGAELSVFKFQNHINSKHS